MYRPFRDLEPTNSTDLKGKYINDKCLNRINRKIIDKFNLKKVITFCEYYSYNNSTIKSIRDYDSASKIFDEMKIP